MEEEEVIELEAPILEPPPESDISPLVSLQMDFYRFLTIL